MSFKPIIINSGQFQQLPAGQALDVGGWTLPASSGTETYVLIADAGGNAVWTVPSFGSDIPANSAANEIYVGTGVGTAAWTTDIVLTSLTVDNITINGAVISSDTGAISFSDEDLTTTGTITGKLVSNTGVEYLEGSAFAYTGMLAHTGALTESGTCVIDLPVGFDSKMQALRVLGYDYSGSGAWSIIVGGYNYNSATSQWLNHHASIQGNPPFTDIRLGWNGNTNKACIMLGTTSSSWTYPTIFLEALVHRFPADYHTGWAINFYTDESNFTGQSGYANPVTVEVYRDFISPTTADTMLVSTGAGAAGWSTDLVGLTSLTVDNITIDGAVISSDTGAISFSNEDLTTTGSVTADSFTDGTASLSSGSLTGVKLGSLTSNGFVKTSGSDGTLSVDTSTYLTAEADTLDTVADRGATTDQTLTVGGISTTGTVVGANIPTPTVTAKVLTSTGSGTATWQDPTGVTDHGALTGLGDDDHTQYVTYSGASGAVDLGAQTLTTTGTVVGANIPTPTVTAKVLTSTGSGTATWQNPTGGVTDHGALTGLGDNDHTQYVTYSGASGAVDLGAQTLTTTGTVVGANIPTPTVDDQVLIATASGVAAWSTAGNNQYLASNGSGDVAWTNKTEFAEVDTLDTVSNRGSTTNQTLTMDGLVVQNTTTEGIIQIWSGESTVTDGQSTLHFLARHSYGGNTPQGKISVVRESDTNTKGGNLVFQTRTIAGTVTTWMTIGSEGVVEFDDITINGDIISSGTGAISFADENLTTTGTVIGTNIPSPTVTAKVLTSTGSGTATWQDPAAGVTDHGALTGLGDNDHTQYVTYSGASGTVNLGAQALATTGNLIGNISALSGITYLEGAAHAYTGLLAFTGNSSYTGTCVIDLPSGFIDRMQVLRILGYDYSATGGAWSIIVGGYNYNTTNDTWLGHHASIQGDPPFTGIRLGWNGNTSKACIMLGTTSTSWSYPILFLETMLHRFSADYRTGWAINFYNDESNFVGQSGYASPVTVEVYRDFISPTTADTVLVSTGAGAADWSNDIALTGTVTGTNIPSPSADDQALSSSASGVASWNATCLADVLAETVPSFSGAERAFVLTADSGGKFQIEAAPWTLTLYADETVYIRTTGNDTTGDGSSGFPFKTLERTIEFIGQLYIGDYIVTVDIGEGVFTEAGTLTFMHPFGSQVTWQGVSEKITSQNTASISASGTSLTYSNLYRYDVTFVLPVGKSVTVGDYIAVRAVSGGTLPNALLGCHYVSGWDGGTRTATVQVVYRNGADKASGTVTCTVELIKTVIAFANKNGLKLNGTYTGGNWRGLVLEGDYNATNTNAKYGIWLLNGAMLNFGGSDASGDAVAIVGFQTGLYAQNNSMGFADYSFLSKCGTRCASAQNGGILNLRYAHLSGANNEGIFCFNGSVCAAQYVTVVASGNNSVYSYQGSFIDARNSHIDENNATNTFLADRWSSIDANSSTYSDSYSPATPGNNDGSYVIIT